MATGAHRRPGRALRHLLRAGRNLIADLDDLPASDEAWTDHAGHTGRERPVRADPSRPGQPPGAEPLAWGPDWWADPAGTAPRHPRPRGRAAGRVRAYLGWRRIAR